MTMWDDLLRQVLTGFVVGLVAWRYARRPVGWGRAALALLALIGGYVLLGLGLDALAGTARLRETLPATLGGIVGLVLAILVAWLSVRLRRTK